MTTRIRLRHDTETSWEATNPVLQVGEPGVEIRTGGLPSRMKVGDGQTPWNSLSYLGNIPSGITPTGPAGGVLGGAYPNPGFAQPMVARADLPSTPSDLVTLSTAQIITAQKTFSANPVFNDASIPQSKVVNLSTDLATLAVDTSVVHLAGTETITGAKTFQSSTSFLPNLMRIEGWNYGTGNPGSRLAWSDGASVNVALGHDGYGNLQMWPLGGVDTAFSLTLASNDYLGNSAASSIAFAADSSGVGIDIISPSSRLNINSKGGVGAPSGSPGAELVLGYGSGGTLLNWVLATVKGPGDLIVGTGVNFSGTVTGQRLTIARSGPTTVLPASSTIAALVVQGASSQSGDLFQAQDNTAAVLAKIDAGGALTARQGVFVPTNTAAYSLIIGQASGQSADLTLWRNASSTAIARVDTTGKMWGAGYGLFATSVTSISAAGAGLFGAFSASTVPLTVKGAASQTADLTQWQNSTGTSLLLVNASQQMITKRASDATKGLLIGGGGFGNEIQFFTADNYCGKFDMIDTIGLRWTQNNASQVAFTIKGATSQTGDMLQLQDSTGAVLSRITSSGYLALGGPYVSFAPNTGPLYVTSSGFTRIGIDTSNSSVNTGFQLMASGAKKWSVAHYVPTGTNTSLTFYNEQTNNSSFTINGDSNTIGVGVVLPLAQFDVRVGTASTVGLLVRGAVSQTGDLFQAQNSSGAVLAKIGTDGSYTTTNGWVTAAVVSSATYIPPGGTMSFQGASTFTTTVTSQQPLLVKGASLTATITNKALTSNVATLTTSAPHGFSSGRRVNVSGVDATFNGGYTITAVTATTFSYAKTAADVASTASGGSATADTQTADLAQLLNGTGDVVTSFSRSGFITVSAGGNIQATYFTDQSNSIAYWLTGTDSTHAWTLYNRTASKVPMSIQGAASQTANLTEWQDNTGAVLANIGPSGVVNFGAGGSAAAWSATRAAFGTASVPGPTVGQVKIQPQAVANYGLVVQGMSGQTGDLFQAQDSSGTMLVGITSAGHLYFNNTTSHYINDDGNINLNAGGNQFIVSSFGMSAPLGYPVYPMTRLWAGVEVISTGALTRVTEVIKAQASQSGDLTEWQNSGGTPLTTIGPDGSMYFTQGGQTLNVPTGQVVAGTGPGLRFYGLTGTGIAANSGNFAFWESGNIALNLTSVLKEFRVPVDYKFAFSSAANNNSSSDTSLYRLAAGVVGTRCLYATATSVGDIPLTAKAMSGQTGDLFQALSSASAPLFSVTAAGLPRWVDASTVQTTVGAAGAASALPSAPTKYLKVVDNAGTTLVIPAYLAA